MGNPKAEGDLGIRPVTILLCDQHDPAVQGAIACPGVSVDGQVCSESSGTLDSCSVRQGCTRRSSLCRRGCFSRRKESQPSKHC